MSIFDDILEDGGEGATSIFAAEPLKADGNEMTIKNSLRTDQLVDVLLVTRDVEIKDKVAEAFAEKNLFSMRVQNARVLQFQETVAEIEKPRLLILDLNTASAIDTEALERIKKTHYSAIPVIVISSYLDQDTVRTLVQIKVDDWLPKDCGPHDIYKSCERVIRTFPAGKPERDAKCYTFLSAAGGSGCTSLAIQTAFLLGRKTSLDTACLVDLNFQDGAVADYLDLPPALTLQDLANSPGRLDRQLLEVMTSRHSSGLAVLAPPRLPARHFELSEGLVASILGLLSKSYETVVIDLPKTWQPWTDNVIWGSNKVFIVTPFTVPSLRHARFLADAIIAKAPTTTRVSVIVNKLRETIFSSGLQRKDAEELLGPRLGGFLPDAGAAVTEAINRGLPVSEVNSGRKLEKRLAEIVEFEDVPAGRQ